MQKLGTRADMDIALIWIGFEQTLSVETSIFLKNLRSSRNIRRKLEKTFEDENFAIKSRKTSSKRKFCDPYVPTDFKNLAHKQKTITKAYPPFSPQS